MSDRRHVRLVDVVILVGMLLWCVAFWIAAAYLVHELIQIFVTR